MATFPPATMVCACIDIGSNTTRVLVADARAGQLVELLQQRVFTRIAHDLRDDGLLSGAKIDEIVAVVARQRALALEAGAVHVRAVGTAGLRGARNAGALLTELRERAGVQVSVLTSEEEARLAFAGATRTLGRPLPGQVGVVDVGGGSTELAVGTLARGVGWSASFAIGSAVLSHALRCADPPSPAQIAALRERAREAFAAADVPQPGCAVAVGGSAASLRRVVGAMLDPGSLERALATLCAAPAAVVAGQIAVAPERIRLLPAGILVLEAASHRLGQPLHIGRGGLREGVLLEFAGGR